MEKRTPSLRIVAKPKGEEFRERKEIRTELDSKKFRENFECILFNDGG